MTEGESREPSPAKTTEPEKKSKPEEAAPAKGKKKEKKGKGGKKGKKAKKTQEEDKEEQEAQEIPPEDPQEKEFRERWEPYEKYLDNLISTKLISAAAVSTGYFLDEMGDVVPVTPLLELLLELHDPNIVFVPSVFVDEPNSFFKLLEGLLNDIIAMGNYMERVYKSAGENYYDDMSTNWNIRELFDEVLSRSTLGAESALDYTKRFEDYAYLWLEDRQEFLAQFLLYGRMLTSDEQDLLKDEAHASEVKESPPTIEQFKEQIDFYEDLYKKLELIETEKIIDGGWLRIDVRPFRQAVLNTVCKWGNLFKQHLYNHVVDSLNDLEQFIEEAIAAMQVTLAEDDYDGLLKVMGYLFKVKERQLATDYMFEPLKQVMELLKEYGVEFPEEIYVQLQEAPDKWTQCKKVCTLIILKPDI